MYDDGIQSDAVQKVEAECEFVDLVEYGAAHFDDCELGRLGWVGAGAEDTQIALDLAFCANRVQKTGNRVLFDVYWLSRLVRVVEEAHTRSLCAAPGASPPNQRAESTAVERGAEDATRAVTRRAAVRRAVASIAREKFTGDGKTGRCEK